LRSKVKLDPVALVLRVDEAKCMAAETVHGRLPIGNIKGEFAVGAVIVFPPGCSRQEWGVQAKKREQRNSCALRQRELVRGTTVIRA
jgi:hypothetical protein